jgi:hypothetical protein
LINLAKLLLFQSFCCLLTVNISALEAPEILRRAAKATETVSTVKFKGQTLTAETDLTLEAGVIDYEQKAFHSVDYKNGKAIAATYYKEGVTYTHNIAADSWLQYPQDIGLSGDILDKNCFFKLFPDNPAEAGFVVTFAGQDSVFEENCYVIQSNVFNKDLAKVYIISELEKFLPRHIASFLRNDEPLLHDYLDIYTQQPQVTLWISQETFRIRKIKRRFWQIAGPGESLLIQREVEYYDFNQPVSVTVPPAAFSGQVVSLEDMGL